MDSIRVLIVAHEDSELRRSRRQLEAAGLEVFTAGTAAAGLLLLGRLQPDALVLDPLAGRGRCQDWSRALERYRSGRPLAVALTTDDPAARRALASAADLGCGPRSFDPQRLASRLVAMEGGSEEGWRQAG